MLRPPPESPNRQSSFASRLNLPFAVRNPGATRECSLPAKEVRNVAVSVADRRLWLRWRVPCAPPRANSPFDSSPLLLFDAHPISLHFELLLIARSPPAPVERAERARSLPMSLVVGSRHRSQCRYKRIPRSLRSFPNTSCITRPYPSQLSVPQDSVTGDLLGRRSSRADLHKPKGRVNAFVSRKEDRSLPSPSSD